MMALGAFILLAGLAAVTICIVAAIQPFAIGKFQLLNSRKNALIGIPVTLGGAFLAFCFVAIADISANPEKYPDKPADQAKPSGADPSPAATEPVKPVSANPAAQVPVYETVNADEAWRRLEKSSLSYREGAVTKDETKEGLHCTTREVAGSSFQHCDSGGKVASMSVTVMGNGSNEAKSLSSIYTDLFMAAFEVEPYTKKDAKRIRDEVTARLFEPGSGTNYVAMNGFWVQVDKMGTYSYTLKARPDLEP